MSKDAQVTPPKVIRWFGEYRIWSSDLHRYIKLVDLRPDGLSAKDWCDAILRADLRTFRLERLIYGSSPTAAAVHRAPVTGYQVQGDCHSPVEVTLWDRTSHYSVSDRRGSTVVVGRCRKCPACLRHRARMWYARSMREVVAADRTWFVTLTWRGDAPTAPYRDIQLYLKRLRRRVGPVRFMAVQEAGDEGGRLHWHLLLHTGDHVRVRHLRHDWPVGFCKFAHATPDKVGYMAHYGVKSMLRVHASLRYGSVPAPSVEGARGSAG